MTTMHRRETYSLAHNKKPQKREPKKTRIERVRTSQRHSRVFFLLTEVKNKKYKIP